MWLDGAAPLWSHKRFAQTASQKPFTLGEAVEPPPRTRLAIGRFRYWTRRHGARGLRRAWGPSAVCGGWLPPALARQPGDRPSSRPLRALLPPLRPTQLGRSARASIDAAPSATPSKPPFASRSTAAHHLTISAVAPGGAEEVAGDRCGAVAVAGMVDVVALTDDPVRSAMFLLPLPGCARATGCARCSASDTGGTPSAATCTSSAATSPAAATAYAARSTSRTLTGAASEQKRSYASSVL